MTDICTAEFWIPSLIHVTKRAEIKSALPGYERDDDPDQPSFVCYVNEEETDVGPAQQALITAGIPFVARTGPCGESAAELAVFCGGKHEPAYCALDDDYNLICKVIYDRGQEVLDLVTEATLEPIELAQEAVDFEKLFDKLQVLNDIIFGGSDD
jgi:hypothetical protein